CGPPRAFGGGATLLTATVWGDRPHASDRKTMQFIDLGAQRERIRDRLRLAMDNVVEGGRYILGPQVGEFEKALADYIGVKHVVACANGTDALLLPLMAYGVGPGDAVFCPSFTFAATAEVVALRQAEPVFVEVDPDTYNIDP